MNDKLNNLNGKCKITKTDLSGNVILETPYYKNLVVDGTDTGFNLILDRLYGTNTYTLNITHLDIGTVNTAPTISDVTLGSAVARASIATKSQSIDSVTFNFFFADADLPNGSYEEVGLFVDGSATISTGKMFTHALFGSTYTKATGENTTIEYILTKN